VKRDAQNPDKDPVFPQSITRPRGTSRLAIPNVSIFLSAVLARGKADVPHCGMELFLRCGEQNVLHRGAVIERIIP